MVRRVIRARTVPEVPRLLGPRLLRVADEADRRVGDVLGEVIPLFRTVGLFDEVVVRDQFGVSLIGLAADEAIEAVVAEAERPVLPVRADVERVHRHVVILPDPERAPPRIA
jgi:hypothetical protein